MLVVECLFIALLVALCVAFRCFPSWRWFTGSVGVLYIVAIGSGWLANTIVVQLRVNEPDPLPSCATSISIIVLGGGTRFDNDLGQYVPMRDSDTKVPAAVALYKRCAQVATTRTIYLSGGDPQHHRIAEAEVFRRQLQALGVPEHDIRVEDRSLNTYQNAKLTTPMLGAQPGGQIYLVTTPYHMRRALAMFERFGVAPIPVASPVSPPKVHDPFRLIRPLLDNIRLTIVSAHEALGLLQLRIYMALGIY